MRNWWNWILTLFLIAFLLVAVPLSLSQKDPQPQPLMKPMFDEYIKKFNKSYKDDPVEYQARYQHFLASVAEIEKLNAQSRGPEQHKARYGLTRLSDMSKTEYQEIHLSDEKMTKPPHQYKKSWSDRNRGSRRNHSDVSINVNINILNRAKRALLPMFVDWRTKGIIGPPRNQGLCGACWAFSTVGTAEAMNALKTGKLQTLSVQEVIDCAGLGNSGCAGGDICLLLDWLVLTNMPIEKESEYPLRLNDGMCLVKKNVTGVRIESFTCDDFVGNEDKILEAISSHGPVAVAVNALTWQNYLGGVIQYHCSGTPAELNHAVELVGYDLTADVPYYIAKNSWGTDFGNNGYIHLAIGSNICGLANEVATVDVV